MRTIGPGRAKRKVPKTRNSRCGNSSAAAAFIGADTPEAVEIKEFRAKKNSMAILSEFSCCSGAPGGILFSLTRRAPGTPLPGPASPAHENGNPIEAQRSGFDWERRNPADLRALPLAAMRSIRRDFDEGARFESPLPKTHQKQKTARWAVSLLLEKVMRFDRKSSKGVQLPPGGSRFLGVSSGKRGFKVNDR